MSIWQAFFDGFSILSEKWAVVLGVTIITCLGCGPSLILLREPSEKRTIHRRSLFLLSGFFGVSVILRLAFLTGAFVPPYFDSVEHFRIIKNLVNALESSTFLETLPRLTSNYYHLGFHALASILAFGLRANPIDVILVLGQVILAAIPIPIFVFLRQETRSDLAAFFGMLLAGFGWYMPGFAVNWGKYPALAGLLVLGVVLGIAYNLSDHSSSQPARIRRRIYLAGLLILGIILSMLFHTRTLVVIAISVVSWFVASKMDAIPTRIQYFLLGLWLVGILVFGTLIQGDPLLNLALDPYLGGGIWVTWTVVALSPFAWMKFPRGFYFSILFTLGVLATLFVPIGVHFPGLENQTLLDRPFVEMVLYLPLSILAGFGLAGFQKTLNNIRSLSAKFNWYPRVLIVVLLVGFTGLMTIGRYDFYPADCCNFVKYDDTIALDWIDRNLPPDVRILVAASQLNVLPTGPSENLVGTDAGIWISALTGRNVSLAVFNIDFRSADTLERLCQKQVEYVYIGGTNQSFATTGLNERPEWYDRILFLQHAQLYQVIGCSR